MAVLSDKMVKDLIKKKEVCINNIDIDNDSIWKKCTLEGHLTESEDEFFTIVDSKELVDLKNWENAKEEWFNKYKVQLRLKKTPNGGERYYMLDPGELILVYTKEKFSLPISAKIMAHVQGKSGLARLGISNHITAPIIHPGFGEKKPMPIMLEIYNHSQMHFKIYPGMPFCQYLFESIEGDFVSSSIQGFALNQTKVKDTA